MNPAAHRAIGQSLHLFVGICILASGCSAIFDVNADDIELIDARRDPRSLWRQPDSAVVFAANLTAAFGSSKPVNTQPLDVQTIRLPLIKGIDGGLYWPFQSALRNVDNPNSAFTVRVYAMPGGQLAQTIDGDQWVWSSDTDFLILRNSPQPDRWGDLILFRIGGQTIREAIPPNSDVNVTPFRASGSIVICDPAATPHTVQAVSVSDDHRLVHTTFDWPSVLDDEAIPSCARFHFDAPSGVLFFTDPMSNTWLQPHGAAPINLGKSYIYDFWPDKVLYADATGELFVYSIPLHASYDLGVSDDLSNPHSRSSVPSSWLLLCGQDGLRSVALDPPRSPALQHLIDPQSCDFIKDVQDGQVHYRVAKLKVEGSQDPDNRIYIEYVAPIDASEPPVLFVGEVPIDPMSFDLARCKGGLRAYAMNIWHEDNVLKRDGWIGDWRFSQEAYDVSFSQDCSRVRWKENVDWSDVGELYSATIPNGRPLRLARNAGPYFEQPDGRVLLRSNLIGIAEEERLLLVDEDARQAHWLLDGTLAVAGAQMVQPLNELLLLVEALNLPGFQPALPNGWYRLPLPPRVMKK